MEELPDREHTTLEVVMMITFFVFAGLLIVGVIK
jgi:hypothetical protein